MIGSGLPCLHSQTQKGLITLPPVCADLTRALPVLMSPRIVFAAIAGFRFTFMPLCEFSDAAIGDRSPPKVDDPPFLAIRGIGYTFSFAGRGDLIVLPDAADL